MTGRGEATRADARTDANRVGEIGNLGIAIGLVCVLRTDKPAVTMDKSVGKMTSNHPGNVVTSGRGEFNCNCDGTCRSVVWMQSTVVRSQMAVDREVADA